MRLLKVSSHPRYDIHPILTTHRCTNSCAFRTSGPVHEGKEWYTRVFVHVRRNHLSQKGWHRRNGLWGRLNERLCEAVTCLWADVPMSSTLPRIISIPYYVPTLINPSHACNSIHPSKVQVYIVSPSGWNSNPRPHGFPHEPEFHNLGDQRSVELGHQWSFY